MEKRKGMKENEGTVKKMKRGNEEKDEKTKRGKKRKRGNEKEKTQTG